MRPGDRKLAQRIEEGLLSFDKARRFLPGILNSTTRTVLIEQILESIRSVNYISVIGTRDISNRRADPNDDMFDPLKAAILHQRNGRIEEAFWLVFLFIHFGKHAKAGYRYVREVCGRLGAAGRWDWARTSADPSGFRAWLDAHQDELRSNGPGFGNHRKRESLDAYSAGGTGAVVESYVGWVGPPRTHQELMEDALVRAYGNPQRAFDDLYRSMVTITRFGRLARFDYLTMVGKLGLALIEPGSTYMSGATGPLKGARLLFGVRENPAKLDRWLGELDAQLNVGMQVIEDALCNWEKSPDEFKSFRG